MNDDTNSPHIGSTLDGLLEADGVREQVHGIAQKRVIAWQLKEEAKRAGVGTAELARRMGTSRTQVLRVFDPANCTVQLDTLQRAAQALGRQLRVELV